jgi:hypothetical protein
MIFLSLLFFALSALREPTGLTWVGYSSDGACMDMALGNYCTCDYVKVWTLSDELFEDASCLDGVFTTWKSSRILWPRTGIACLPDEYFNLTQLDPQRLDI